MCLDKRLRGQEKVDAINALPETFFVWKYCPKGQLEFYSDNSHWKEPKVSGNKWFKAGSYPMLRNPLEYKEGFHAFLNKKEDLEHFWPENLRMFKARRRDVMEIGRYNDLYFHLEGVVLNFIKPANNKITTKQKFRIISLPPNRKG